MQDSTADFESRDELAELIGWSAEIAADTEISEQQWMPIYELSERLRLSIAKQPDGWDEQRCDQAIRLCQLLEEAWQSLPLHQRQERFLVHDHDHGHSHDHDHRAPHEHHDDHSHDDHSHSHSKPKRDRGDQGAGS